MSRARYALVLLILASWTQAQTPPGDAGHGVRLDRYGDPLPPGAVARIGSLRFSGFLSRGPDGSTLATIREGRIAVIHPTTGAEIRRLPGPDPAKFETTFFQFSDDGSLVAYAGADSIEVWDVARGERIGRVSGVQRGHVRFYMRPMRMTFLDGDRLVLASEYGHPLRCCNYRSDRELWKVEQMQSCRCLGATRDGHTLALGVIEGPDKLVRLFTSAGGAKTAEFKLDVKINVNSGAIAPDGESVAFADEDGMVRRFAIPTGNELLPPFDAKLKKPQWAGQVDHYCYLGFSPDGTKLVATDYQGVSLFNAETGQRIGARINISGGWLWQGSSVFTADGLSFWANDPSKMSWRSFDAATGSERKLPMSERLRDIQSLVVSPEGKLAVFASHMGSQQYDLTTGRKWQRPKKGFFSAFTSDSSDSCQAYAFSPNGATLAGLDYSGVKIWNVATGKETKSISLGEHSYRSDLAYSPDGKTLAISPGMDFEQRDKEQFTRIFDAATGRQVNKIRVPAGQLSKVQFSPDGRWLASLNRDWYERQASFDIHDLATGKLYWGGNEEMAAATFMPYGRLIAYSNERGVAIWEPLAGTARVRWATPQNEVMQVLSVSPDGRWLAGCGGAMGERGGAWLWDLHTDAPATRLIGHSGPVIAVAFAGDDKLVTASTDGTALVWELKGRESPIKPGPSNEANLIQLWQQLGGDGPAAHFALERLRAAGQPAIDFLRGHLRPASQVNATEIMRQLEGLDARQFAVREQAARQIELFDVQAEPYLRKYAAEAATAEARRRAERLLDRLDGAVSSPEHLRQLRAVELLGRVGSPQAKGLLTELATKGDPDARLTQEAKAALVMLTWRTRP